MAQGGTLPIKREQTVSLYNTTGVIERDKNIYFSPFITHFEGKIKGMWLAKFKLECPSPTDYTDISISQWSPEDRTLKVRGNVDDFRLVTEHGLALNYLILTRKVYDSESSFKTYYYAFFITSVSQAGSGSVLLSLEPDHFTNVFYLHNEESFSGEGYYDAFNGKMKNNYVIKQHYNRVKVESTTVTKTADDEDYEATIEQPSYIDNLDYIQLVTINTSKPIKNILQVAVESVDVNFDYDDCHINGTPFKYGDVWQVEIRFTNVYTEPTYLDVNYINLNIEYTYDETTYEIKEDNLPIFSQIEESFKFKRLVRDYKELLNYGDSLTEEEKQAYEEAQSWSDLTSDLKIKALKLCTAYLHVVLKDDFHLLRNNIGSATVFDGALSYYPNLSKVEDNMLTLCIPIMNIIELFKKFESSIKSIFNNIKYKQYYYNSTSQRYETRDTEGLSLLNPSLFLSPHSVFTEYVISAYVTKESSIVNFLDYSSTEIVLRYSTMTYNDYKDDSEISSKSGKFRILYSPTSVSAIALTNQTQIYTKIYDRDIYYLIDYSNPNKLVFSGINGANTVPIALMITEETLPINFVLDLSKENIPDLETNYFDTVLTFNPYSFYSVSYLGRIETTLNKLNYYENPIIKCKLTVRVCDTLKYSFVPIYEINGKEYKYYSEGIEQTSSNNLTIMTSKLSDYIIANSAQMKNQYAVNELHNEYGIDSALISSSLNTLSSAVKGGLMGGGWQGALAGAVSGVAGGINSFSQVGIDFEKGTKTIELNHKAKLSDMGNMPSNLKQVGTDIAIDLSLNELGLYLNHYKIDEVSYNSICKYLERFGYMVNIYDDLHVTTRVGWDFVQLASFDYEATINTVQEESIRQIFAEGVTLLHNKSVLANGHNYETILEEVM